MDFRGEIDDATIIDALNLVGLWTLVHDRGGINAEFEHQSLSHGQQQLLALARAIVRRRLAKGRCILVLDEATSNLDTATETFIQSVIAREFKSNTIIAVAHRLETLLDYDIVIELESGRIVRSGAPKDIL
jgi:ATP-binding cassette subfamily C (CFTR/MRP) protein 1